MVPKQWTGRTGWHLTNGPVEVQDFGKILPIVLEEFIEYVVPQLDKRKYERC